MNNESKSNTTMAKKTDLIVIATATAKPGKEKEIITYDILEAM
jgi:hypothetical protein